MRVRMKKKTRVSNFAFALFQELNSRENESENEEKNQSVKLRSRFVSKILLKSENECENEQKNQSIKLRSRFVSPSGF
jgi:hypothetical protein